jgi:hypothetical protein
MRPSLLVLDHRYGGLPDAEPSGYLRLRPFGKKDRPRLGFREFGFGVRLSSRIFPRRPPTALIHHVADVVVVCPEPKVCRVHARAIVATVKDVHPSRNGSIRQLPRQPVGSVFNILDAKSPVSMVADSAGEDVASRVINAGVVVEPLLRRPMPRAERASVHGGYYNDNQHLVKLERRF